jgi:hypothetical protein
MNFASVMLPATFMIILADTTVHKTVCEVPVRLVTGLAFFIRGNFGVMNFASVMLPATY